MMVSVYIVEVTNQRLWICQRRLLQRTLLSLSSRRRWDVSGADLAAFELQDVVAFPSWEAPVKTCQTALSLDIEHVLPKGSHDFEVT